MFLIGVARNADCAEVFVIIQVVERLGTTTRRYLKKG